jgi:hypothetical protein
MSAAGASGLPCWREVERGGGGDLGATLQVHLPAGVTAARVRLLCADLSRQLATGTVSAVVCRADDALGDLDAVDAVARLALVARRASVAFFIDGARPALSGLLVLVGLQRVLSGPEGASGGQAALDHVEQAVPDVLDRRGVERAQGTGHEQRGQAVDR